jgi:hypothetical protein
VGIGLGYFWGKKVIYGTIGKENRNFVELYSRGITSSILAETEDVIAYFNDPCGKMPSGTAMLQCIIIRPF